MKGKILLLVMFVVLTPAHAKKSKKKQQGLHMTMRQVGKSMKELFPYMFSIERFRDPKNERKINQSLEELTSLFGQVERHFGGSALNYQVSYGVMLDHLRRTQKSFQNDNKIFSQVMLKDTTSICMNCHTQDRKSKGLFMNVTRHDFDSDFEYGEFNFMTRNYTKANRYYDRYLTSQGRYPDVDKVRVALRRKITIYVQIEKKPKLAISQLENYLSKKDLPGSLKVEIKEWIAGLKEWRKDKSLQQSRFKWSELKRLAKKYLTPMSDGGAFNISGKEEILYIRLAGLLYDHLRSRPSKKQIPEVLYWLSVCDRILNYNYFYSLADLYLKECVTRYPKHPYAEKCYVEYKEYVNFSFTGSGVSEIPEDVKAELQKLKAKLEKNL